YYKELLSTLQGEENLGVLYLDIDNLKRMNDTFGHDEGDLAILRAAALIHRYEEPGFECCRVGGDEFVILLRNAGDRVEELVARMRGDKGNLLSEITEEFTCRLAVGGASRRAGETLEEVIKRAEEEMYQNKHAIR
ncbi:MAG: GGDEF domain-containing protein, partial [Lachnospiraceae bacterium]|nr:GGDEF domain-containing protein [Lachnospiraceae bacterium]